MVVNVVGWGTARGTLWVQLKFWPILWGWSG